MSVLHLAKSSEASKSGPLGLVLILVLCVACYFLFKSLSKHLRKVREEFPTELPPPPGTPKSGAPAKPDAVSDQAAPDATAPLEQHEDAPPPV